eukprot:8611317-Pyramimonas_sp.AAC.1
MLVAADVRGNPVELRAADGARGELEQDLLEHDGARLAPALVRGNELHVEPRLPDEGRQLPAGPHRCPP